MDGTTPDRSLGLTRKEFLKHAVVDIPALLFLASCSAQRQQEIPGLIPLELRKERINKLGLEPFWDFYSESQRFAEMLPGWKMYKFPEILSELDLVATGEITSPNDLRLRTTTESRWGNRIGETEKDAISHVEGLKLWTGNGFQSANGLPEIKKWLSDRAAFVPKLILACPGEVGTNPDRNGGAWFTPGTNRSDSRFIFNNLDDQEAAIVGWLHETVHAYEQYYLELSPYYSRQDAGKYMAARVASITDSLVAFARADGQEGLIFKEGRPLIPEANIPKIYKETPGYLEGVMEKSSAWLGTPKLAEGSLHEKYNFLTQALVSYWINNRDTVPVDRLSSDWDGKHVRNIIWSAIAEIDHYHVGPIQNKERGLISGADQVAMPESELAKISVELEKTRRETLWGISEADRWKSVRRSLGLVNEKECIIDVENFCVNVGDIELPTTTDMMWIGGTTATLAMAFGAVAYLTDPSLRKRVNKQLFGKGN